ncbi:MAG: uracil-DNA glycosylase family protein [Candidatus Bilamarchaeaceae archaeon]
MDKVHAARFDRRTGRDLVIAAIGEAPGESENLTGKPFTGPSGELLSEIIKDAIQEFQTQPIVILSNVVSCIPYDDEGDNVRPPNAMEIKACSDRLKDFLSIVKPDMIICVGAVAKKVLSEKVVSENYPFVKQVVSIVHPAFILRQPASKRNLEIARTKQTIRLAIKDSLYETCMDTR